MCPERSELTKPTVQALDNSKRASELPFAHSVWAEEMCLIWLHDTF